MKTTTIAMAALLASVGMAQAHAQPIPSTYMDGVAGGAHAREEIAQMPEPLQVTVNAPSQKSFVSIVSQEDQRADATRQAAAKGKVLAAEMCMSPGRGGPELQFCATDGTKFSVTNIIINWDRASRPLF